MATFRASIQGSKGIASRLGHSEIWAAVDAWDYGIRVWAHKDESGIIRFTVHTTGGSNSPIEEECILEHSYKEIK